RGCSDFWSHAGHIPGISRVSDLVFWLSLHTDKTGTIPEHTRNITRILVVNGDVEKLLAGDWLTHYRIDLNNGKIKEGSISWIYSIMIHSGPQIVAPTSRTGSDKSKCLRR